MVTQHAGSILGDYSAGRLGTRAAIDALEMNDFGDLLIALSRAGLPLPPPVETARIVADRLRSREVLVTRLTRAD